MSLKRFFFLIWLCHYLFGWIIDYRTNNVGREAPTETVYHKLVIADSISAVYNNEGWVATASSIGIIGSGVDHRSSVGLVHCAWTAHENSAAVCDAEQYDCTEPTVGPVIVVDIHRHQVAAVLSVSLSCLFRSLRSSFSLLSPSPVLRRSDGDSNVPPTDDVVSLCS